MPLSRRKYSGEIYGVPFPAIKNEPGETPSVASRRSGRQLVAEHSLEYLS